MDPKNKDIVVWAYKIDDVQMDPCDTDTLGRSTIYINIVTLIG